MVDRDRYHSVHQCVLGFVNASVFFGIAREDHGEVGMDCEVPFIHPANRQLEQAFLEDAEEHIVGLGPGTIEFVVNDGETILARACKTVVHPGLGEVLLGLDNRVNEVVNDS